MNKLSLINSSLIDIQIKTCGFCIDSKYDCISLFYLNYEVIRHAVMLLTTIHYLCIILSFAGLIFDASSPFTLQVQVLCKQMSTASNTAKMECL